MKKKFKIDLSGEITLHHLSSYKASLSTLLEEDLEIVLNLSHVSKIDLAGIQLILSFIETRAKTGNRVIIDYHDNQEILTLFKMVGIDKII